MKIGGQRLDVRDLKNKPKMADRKSGEGLLATMFGVDFSRR